VGGLQVCGGVPLKGIVGPEPLLHSLFLLPGHEVGCFAASCSQWDVQPC
jgi:hypothetical protein